MEGGSKQCDTTTLGSNFTVRARGMRPRKLAACRPWEIQWLGGTAPYTVTLMAFEQSGLKMMKFMGVNETKFTFINTFNPNSLLIGKYLIECMQGNDDLNLILRKLLAAVKDAYV